MLRKRADADNINLSITSKNELGITPISNSQKASSVVLDLKAASAQLALPLSSIDEIQVIPPRIGINEFTNFNIDKISS